MHLAIYLANSLLLFGHGGEYAQALFFTFALALCAMIFSLILILIGTILCFKTNQFKRVAGAVLLLIGIPLFLWELIVVLNFLV